MCLLLSLMFLGPRAALFLYWLGWPHQWDKAFDTFIVPFIGVMIVPWATLAYVLAAPDGVEGWDYLWIGLGLLVDLATVFSDGMYGRQRQRSTSPHEVDYYPGT